MGVSDASMPLAFAVASWLESQQDAKLKEAASLVSTACGFDTASADDKEKYAKNSPGLQAIFDVFLKTQQRLNPAGAKKSDDTPVSDEAAAKAEALKNDGNKYMSAKDYGAALDAYTKAIELNPTSPVFYSNRAAAYSQIGQHDEAISDAKKASEIDPKFSKAYSRLGHALFASGRFDEAVKAYEKGVELDPSNKLMKSGLDASKAKLGNAGNKDAVATMPSHADAANTDPFAGAGAGAGMGGAGGMPDLGSLMNNPMVAQMAQQMMQNGGLQQLMNNPMLRQMAENFGANGQMPDVSSLMNNPQLRQYVLAPSKTNSIAGWLSSSWVAWAAHHVSTLNSRHCPRVRFLNVSVTGAVMSRGMARAIGAAAQSELYLRRRAAIVLFQLKHRWQTCRKKECTCGLGNKGRWMLTHWHSADIGLIGR